MTSAADLSDEVPFFACEQPSAAASSAAVGHRNACDVCVTRPAQCNGRAAMRECGSNREPHRQLQEALAPLGLRRLAAAAGGGARRVTRCSATAARAAQRATNARLEAEL